MKENWRAAYQEALRLKDPTQRLLALMEALSSVPEGDRDWWEVFLAVVKTADAVRDEALLAEVLRFAAERQDETLRARALATLAPALPERLRHEALAQALQIVRRLTDPEARAGLLEVLAPHLPPELQEDALEEALALPDESARVDALVALVPHLSEALQVRALDVVATLRNEDLRAQALEGMAPHLSEPLLERALKVAFSLGDPGSRIQALSALLPHLPPELGQGARRAALEAVAALEDPELRAYASLALAPHFPEGEREALLGQALRAAEAVEDEALRTRILVDLAPALPETFLPRILDRVRELKDPKARAAVLDALAPHLPEEVRAGLLQDPSPAAAEKGTDSPAQTVRQTAVPTPPEEAPLLSGLEAEVAPERRLEVAPQALADRPSREDYLGYARYADVLAEFIKHEKTGKPLTLAITAPWGMGKTTLMRMIQARLTEAGAEGRGRSGPLGCLRRLLRPRAEAVAFPVVWFEAWTYDQEESLWSALVLEILRQVRRQVGACRWARIWLGLLWDRLDKGGLVRRFGRALGVSLGLYLTAAVAAWTYARLAQLDLRAFLPYAGGAGVLAVLAPAARAAVQGLRAALPFDFNAYLRQPDYQARIGFLAQFARDFRRVVDAVTEEGRWPLVVFIDDLDRCAPPKPVEIVEAINHLVDAEHCVFLLGMDEQMVARSIEVKYRDLAGTIRDPGGMSLGEYFLEKIVQLQFRIPPPDADQMERYVDRLLGPTRGEGPPQPGGEAQGPEESEVWRVAELVQAERRAGIEDLDRAAEAVQRKRPRIDAQILAQAKEVVRVRFAESPEVRQAIYRALPYLGGNPRKVKRFINAFRLQTMLARELGWIQDTQEDLDLLARAVIAWMRWPGLVRTALRRRDGLRTFWEACRAEGEDREARIEALPAPLKELATLPEARAFVGEIDDLDRFERLLDLAALTAEGEVGLRQKTAF